MLSSAAAAGVLSTAFDQTSEFVQAVMDHIGPMKRQETNAWATVIGDKTKVSGLQSDFGYSKLERDSYGIAVGADVALAANLRAGAAFAYTSGSTKNNSNAVLKLKDEFSSMSFGIYSRYGFGPFTVDAHAGYTRLSSDLSDNLGITDADVDTDLYTVGVRGGFGLLAVDTVIYPFIGADLYVMETADYSIAPGVKSVAGGKTTTLRIIGGFETPDKASGPRRLQVARHLRHRLGRRGESGICAFLGAELRRPEGNEQDGSSGRSRRLRL